MKRIFFAVSGLSLLAFAASAMATDEGTYPRCISFAPGGFCDAMEFDGKTQAIWRNYDCAGSQGLQTRGKYKGKKAHTFCDGTAGCEPAVAFGWDSFTFRFDLTASTGTLTAVSGGVRTIIQKDFPVAITEGACDFSQARGGVSSLSR